MEFTFSGKENKITADHLRAGETCKVTGYGNSMVPILKSGQSVICIPVNGHFYLHLIHSIRNDKTYLIGNNHGHMNGWVNKNNIFGVVAEIL